MRMSEECDWQDYDYLRPKKVPVIESGKCLSYEHHLLGINSPVPHREDACNHCGLRGRCEKALKTGAV